MTIFVAAACRTSVAPNGGDFARLEVARLGSEVIRALLTQTPLSPDVRLEVIMGNALYGGGNPARVAMLMAGLDIAIPAATIDTQCCSGLDAIAWGASRIASGQADAVIAGGLESYSRAPLRYKRPASSGDSPQFYARPPFTPWLDRDPDLIASAASLAYQRNITREQQDVFAVDSHRKALEANWHEDEIAPVCGIETDTFSRRLSPALCARLPSLAGRSPHELTAATIAVEADAAAAVLLVSEKLLSRLKPKHVPMQLSGSVSRGFDPEQPALAATSAAAPLLRSMQIAASDISVVEIMEAFAVQAMTFIDDLNFDASVINRSGGALARGHPIGASGAILAVRLFYELQKENRGAKGLAAIAAAGGLGSALLMERA